MKPANTIVLAWVLTWLTGCASPSLVTVLEPIGPAPEGQPKKDRDGNLQVYSARDRARIDVNMEERLWDDDFGRNEFQYDPAHTDYSIYNQDGAFLKRVRNARDQNDPTPTVVHLPPGSYEIQAEAEDYSGTIEVRVPVVILAGRTTRAHLIGGWKPRRRYNAGELVRLPDGGFAGWLAAH